MPELYKSKDLNDISRTISKKVTMKSLPVASSKETSCSLRPVAPGRKRLIARATAAPQLSPKEAGTESAKNQLDALKQMSKIVADSGVSSSKDTHQMSQLKPRPNRK